jgi:hypothetical protein
MSALESVIIIVLKGRQTFLKRLLKDTLNFAGLDYGGHSDNPHPFAQEVAQIRC